MIKIEIKIIQITSIGDKQLIITSSCVMRALAEVVMLALGTTSGTLGGSAVGNFWV